MLRYALALLVLSAPLAAQDGLKTYVKERKRLRRAADRYWETFRTRENSALVVFRKPWFVMGEPGYDRSKTRHGRIRDFSAYRKLYMDYVKIETALGEAQIALARSEHPKALKKLFAEFWDFADRVDAVERDLWKQNPSGGWSSFEQQRHGVLRHGLAMRRPLLLRALATVQGGVEYIATSALDQARKRDRRRSFERRVGLLDALGMSDKPAAQPVLQVMVRADQTYLRIAALEALMGFDGAQTALQPLLRDESSIVRRALLAAIRRDPEPSWISPVLSLYLGAKHLERAEYTATLTALTRQRFGDDPERWKTWFETHREAIEAGTFDASKVAAEDVKTRAPPERITFYGTGTPSHGVIFILDGSSNLLMPVDCTVQVTRHHFDWWTGDRGWRKDHPSHETIQRREFKEMLQKLPADARFGALMVKESGGVKTIGEKRLLRATRQDKRRAYRFLEKHAPRGWRPELSNLVTAMEMAGLRPHGLPDIVEPRADTVFLVDDGSVRTGRFVLPEAMLAAIERLNRFRRLVIHTIHTCEVDTYCAPFLKRLAESSGGTYRRFVKP